MPILPPAACGRITGKVGEMSDQVEVSMALEPAQALALAQFVKRVRWKALAEAGYATR